MLQFAKMASVEYGIRISYRVIFILIPLLLWCNTQITLAQEDYLAEEISRYEADVEKNPDDAKKHRKLGLSYAQAGMADKAKEQIDIALELEHNRGYEEGAKDAAKHVYGRYLILSVVVGLFVSAIIVSILMWAEVTDKIRTIRMKGRIRDFIKGINVQFNPELQNRAAEIARQKEALRAAISREKDENLKEAAATVLPKLDDLTNQAALLLELQQNLQNHVKDMDPENLESTQSECEEKLATETDDEVRRALEYQLEQVKNKRAIYRKAQAKIRTCDAVLSGIAARIDATSLDLMSVPSVLIRKQEFFEKISTELDEEINLTRDAAETVMEESS